MDFIQITFPSPLAPHAEWPCPKCGAPQRAARNVQQAYETLHMAHSCPQCGNRMVLVFAGCRLNPTGEAGALQTGMVACAAALERQWLQQVKAEMMEAGTAQTASSRPSGRAALRALNLLDSMDAQADGQQQPDHLTAEERSMLAIGGEEGDLDEGELEEGYVLDAWLERDLSLWRGTLLWLARLVLFALGGPPEPGWPWHAGIRMALGPLDAEAHEAGAPPMTLGGLWQRWPQCWSADALAWQLAFTSLLNWAVLWALHASGLY